MPPRLVSVPEAADALGLPVSGVEALAGAGYLHLDGERRVSLSEVKAFQARNTAGSGETADELLGAIGAADEDAEAILDILERSVDDMARRAADIVASTFPDARWSATERDRFERQTRARFEAIVAVTRSETADDELLEDLADAGGAAAFAGAPLPEVLLALRISRDLLVQAAVGAAEELGQLRSIALAVVLTRVLPVLDRLTDTVTRGWWSAVRLREQEALARYEHMVENAGHGVYEVELDGTVSYANTALARLAGHPLEQLVGRDLAVALPPVEPALGVDVYRVPTVTGWRPLKVLRADGVERELLLQVTERTEHGRAVGFDGIVRDVTPERQLERQKNDFLALVTDELRQPLATVLGLGVTLAAEADELPRDRIAQMGRTIHVQSDRIARLADDLHDVSRIRADALTLLMHRVDVAPTVAAAIRMLPGADAVQIDVPSDLEVHADGRRLRHVIAHLVENALRHGAPPVSLRAGRTESGVHVEVTDHGAGVPLHLVDTMFASLAPSAADDRLRDRPSGLGLPLARSLVEAMGGRIRHERRDGCTRFVVTLPT
ncbi:MAG TPA: ATP-binding protein [Acidimicrobiales bacterium]|nr:ATP-binding protein [Acidimicrobiales bacterium]